MPIGTGNPTESFINHSVSEGCAIIILHLYRILFIGLRMVADWPDEAVKKVFRYLASCREPNEASRANCSTFAQ